MIPDAAESSAIAVIGDTDTQKVSAHSVESGSVGGARSELEYVDANPRHREFDNRNLG